MTLPIAGHEYAIISKILVDNKFHVEKYTGKCHGAYAGGIDWLFMNVARINRQYHVKSYKNFSKWDEYYDLKGMKSLIENARTARQTMEKRSLDMILKRLINEEFQW